MEYFAVPHSLGMPGVLGVVQRLHGLPRADSYRIDFGETQHFEPFGMLLVGSAIRRLRERTTGSGAKVVIELVGKSLAKQGHRYAQRMGFWWSIGDAENLPTVGRGATGTTIPITRLSIEELYRLSCGVDPIRSDVVSRAAADLATTLCGDSNPTSLWLSLEYCLREMFRNVVEHSGADAIWYTAATRPKKDDVQIAILDGGRGIRDSLSDHPQQRHESDMVALKAAIRAGVSRNAGKTRTAEQTRRLQDEFPGREPTFYDNSGLGLTLTTNLAKHAGQIALVSGTACLAYMGEALAESETRHSGTALRLSLQPSKLEGALTSAQLRADRDSGKPRSGSLITASMVTRLGLDKADD